MRKCLLVMFALVSVLLAACAPGAFKPDHKYKIEDFTFDNHRGEKVSLDDLKGDVWLAQFVFTNCTTVCLPMMANMIELQDMMEEEGLEDYHIVSFSVDPAVDTPERLAEYLEGYHPVDESKWEMLTGYSQEFIEKFAVDSFRQIVIDDPESDQVIHGTAFVLVNQDGVAVKTYGGVQFDGTREEHFGQIIEDMKKLQQS